MNRNPVKHYQDIGMKSINSNPEGKMYDDGNDFQILIPGSATCGKTLMQKAQIEHLLSQMSEDETLLIAKPNGNEIRHGYGNGDELGCLKMKTPIIDKPKILRDFENELMGWHRNELENEQNDLEMNTHLKMNVEMNRGTMEMKQKNVEMNYQPTITYNELQYLQQNLSYINLKSSLWFGNGKHWIEITFILHGGTELMFKVNCTGEHDARGKLKRIRSR